MLRRARRPETRRRELVRECACSTRRKSGTIQLHITPPRRRLLTVTDDGYGIDQRARARTVPALLDRIREPAAARDLGLYIVRRIAEENGGSRARCAARSPAARYSR